MTGSEQPVNEPPRVEAVDIILAEIEAAGYEIVPATKWCTPEQQLEMAKIRPDYGGIE